MLRAVVFVLVASAAGLAFYRHLQFDSSDRIQDVVFSQLVRHQTDAQTRIRMRLEAENRALRDALEARNTLRRACIANRAAPN